MRRILQAWNIHPSAVVFIDDSPLELAEVQSAFPDLECIRFPKGDPSAVLDLLRRLRDWFGKFELTAEDRLRSESIASKALFEAAAGSVTDQDAFLQSLRGTIEVDSSGGRADARAFELVNKTNQFNLNGGRYTLDQWMSRGTRPTDFVLTFSYRDRFGPLGKIAAMAGCRADCAVDVEDWVISCRAFSRRIEHVCLGFLFTCLGVDEVRLHYRPTGRNGPVQSLLRFYLDSLPPHPEGAISLARVLFQAKCPALYNEICTRVDENG